MKVAKILINAEAATAATQNDEKILIETVERMQEKHFWLAIINLFCIYIIFAINKLNFSLASFQKIIIYKNNSMCTVLNPNFDTKIFGTKS